MSQSGKTSTGGRGSFDPMMHCRVLLTKRWTRFDLSDRPQTKLDTFKKSPF